MSLNGAYSTVATAPSEEPPGPVSPVLHVTVEAVVTHPDGTED